VSGRTTPRRAGGLGYALGMRDWVAQRARKSLSFAAQGKGAENPG
jgi:hypothetical protein